MKSILSLPLAAAVLLSSCSWHLGAGIREAHEVRTGVDISRPVDGKLYAARNPLDGWDYYVQAPVVTYNPDTPIVAAGQDMFLKGIPDGARNVKDTGDFRWCRVLREVTGGVTTGNYAELRQTNDGSLFVESLPAGARPAGVIHPEPGCTAPLYIKREFTRWHAPASVLAAPLDYVVDPILSLVTTPVYLIIEPVCGKR